MTPSAHRVTPSPARANEPGHCLVVGAEPPHDVFRDVIGALESRGWRITWCLAKTRPKRAAPMIERGLASTLKPVRDIARLARRVQVEWAAAPEASRWLSTLARQAADESVDVILALLDMLPIGTARLLQRAGRPIVFETLVALQQEVQGQRLLALGRLVLSAFGSARHPDLWRPALPARLKTVVIPTDTLRRTAVAAGLPSEACRLIPFGVPVPEQLRGRSYQPASPARLLWVGRLSPEKGLHLFLAALPAVAAQRDVRLTVIAATGPEGYGHTIREMLAKPDVARLTTVVPAQPRAEMIRAFDDHDLLLFHSVFAEPVAQIMLHAAAAGLPIAAPASPYPGSLLRDGETAACYRDPSPSEVARTILVALEDEAARRARALRLFEEVRDGHSLQRTIDDYDALLRQEARRSGRPSDEMVLRS